MARTSIARVFQVSLYALTVLAGLMVALSESAFFPGTATLPVAIAAFFGNVLRGRLRLPQRWFQILVVGAIGIAGVEYLQGTIELRVLAVQHLLVYLTWIVLFMHRPPRHYWWLCGLGLLQVAFGAILTGSGWFGVLLIVYLLLGIWTLAVFTLYQGELISETVAASASSRRSGVRNSIQFERSGKWFSFRFAANVVLLALVGTCLGGALFLFVPRVWSGDARASIRDNSDTSSTGFSEEVRLGAMGEILENSQRVLQVRLFNNDSNLPLDVVDYAASFGYEEPYFRGMVLETYSRGQWKSVSAIGRWTKRFEQVPPGLVRQEYTLEGLRTNVLFAMSPFIASRMRVSQQYIEMNLATSVLSTIRIEGQVREYFVYSRLPGPSARTTSFLREFPVNASGTDPLPRYRMVPEELGRTRQLTEEVIRNIPVEEGDSSNSRKAQAIVEHLRDSGEYGYTLKAGVVDPQIDPVEDFLFNRREGHCEHFASALALMLRSAGIPARLVTGFKGGRFNELTNAFEVQQRHAHSWVEAHVNGKWLTLDATPTGRQEALEQSDRTPAFWKNLTSFSSSGWDTYIMRLDGSLQQELLYDPLQKKIGSSLQAFRSNKRTQNSIRLWFREFYTTPQVWLGWRGLLAVCVLGGLAWGLLKLIRRLPGWTRRFRQLLENVAGRREVHVDFYERFCRLAAIRGFERRPEQTQREFIEQTASVWNDPTRGASLLMVPSRLPELFYSERFGGEAVSAEERAALQRELDGLELAMQQANPRP